MSDGLPPSPPAIVITGTALPEPKAERVYATARISQRQIEESPTHELDQLLKDVPGVQLFRRSDARSGHPTSQGVTLRALGGNASSRAMLVLDGVPQSDPFGGWVNWPAYDPSGLAGIRIVRGGGSVGNGPGALAGTIEMTSRANAGVDAELDRGSRNSAEARLRGGAKVASGVLAVTGRFARGDGFVPVVEASRGLVDRPAPYDRWSSRARLLAPVHGEIEAQASLAAFHDWRTRGTEFSADRTNGVDASLRLVGRGPWQWSALGYWQWRDLQSSTASINPARTFATRVLLQDKVPSHGVGASFEVRPPVPAGIEMRIGADIRRTVGETRELSNYVSGSPTRRRYAGGLTTTAGIFAEASKVEGSATFSGGVRIDRWSVDDGHLFERVIASGAVLRDERYAARSGWLPTARGGVIADIGRGVSLRGAAYLGWRMPTLNELFRPFRAGADATAANPQLKPERLGGAEAGLEFESGPWNLSFTGFANRLQDAIANVTLGAGPGNFPQVGFVATGGSFRQRQNVDAASVKGIEASTEWTRGPWALRAGMSLSYARMAAAGAASSLNGLRPAQTPLVAATLSAGWERDGKSAQLVLRHVGAQYEDDLNRRIIDGATTLDTFSSWPLTNRLLLVARVENATDKLVIAGVGGDGTVERATPRTIWIGVRLR